MSAPTVPWDRLMVGAEVATMADDIGIGHIADGAVAVRDGKIAWLGTRDALSQRQWSATQITDAKGLWITPGLIECHTHLVYAGDRSAEFSARLQGSTYEEIARQGGGILATVRATRAARADVLFEQSLQRASALRSEGVTTLEIKSGYGLELDTELKMLRVARRIGVELGISVVKTFLGAHALPPEFAGRADDYIRTVCDVMLPRVASERLADAVDVFCETIAFSQEQTTRVFEAAQRLGLPLRLHADQLSDGGGGALAGNFRALSADHLEHTSSASLEAMARHGTVAGLLPGAFYYLRESQLPPIAAMRALRIPMAVSTDCNPGTSPLTSLLFAMNMASVIFRLTPEEVLRGVTVNAARALGLAHDRGALKPGMRADLALWRIRHPEQLCAEIGIHRPHEVLVAGETVVKNEDRSGQ